MKNRVPSPAPVLDFTPVPRKYRYDGWTVERQRAFIAALAETGSVVAAARRVNMSAEGAYQLRLHPEGASLAAAWTAALAHGVQNLVDVAIARALEGVPVPIFYKGEQVGERRWYNDRLLMFTIKHHVPHSQGGALPEGTKHPDTIAREAAENCPVCRARAEEQATIEAGGDDPWLDDILKRYRAKVRAERQLRLEGDIVGADFTLRQLTHIELILDVGGRVQDVIDTYATTPPDVPGNYPVEQLAGPAAAMLDRIRREAWAAMGDPTRPALPDQPGPVRRSLGGTGCDADGGRSREAGKAEAKRLAAHAQAMWEATATEQGWKAWLAESNHPISRDRERR